MIGSDPKDSDPKGSDPGQPRNERVSTGVPGLDAVLRGGLPSGGTFIIRGAPGAGKTVLANQICFHHVTNGGQALYITLLAENHDRLLQHMAGLAFYDPAPISRSLTYISGFSVLESEGLKGLAALLRREMRSRRTTLLVLDGLLAVEEASDSDGAFRKFIHELQFYVAAERCVALLLTNGGRREYHPEHTMVEGLITLDDRPVLAHRQRELEVLKLRGAGFLRGRHPFRITDAGIVVYPRLEAVLAPESDAVPGERMSLGVPRLDTMVGGGVLMGTTTMLLGAAGTGKTTLGLHFLAQSTEHEPGLLFGFYEMPERLLMNAASLGLDLQSLAERGHLEFLWQPPVEQILDDIGQRLVDAIRRRRVKRLFVDGLGGYVAAAADPARVSSFFTAISNECRRLGVTTVYTVETSNLVGPTITVPVDGVSAVAENLLLLRFVELRARLYRMISVLKVRGSAFDPTLREFQITESGIVLADTFESAESILSGFGMQASATLQGNARLMRRKHGQG